MNQIASALYYLHSYGIAHRDLKLENILLVDESDESPIKLADFGLAKMLGPNETSNEKFGTMGYVAPEVLLGWSYTKSVDLWSLGVIIYILTLLAVSSIDNQLHSISKFMQAKLFGNESKYSVLVIED